MPKTETVRVQMFVRGKRQPVRVLEVGGTIPKKQLSALDGRLQAELNDIDVRADRMPDTDDKLFCYMLPAKKWNADGMPERVETVIAMLIDTTYGLV